MKTFIPISCLLALFVCGSVFADEILYTKDEIHAITTGLLLDVDSTAKTATLGMRLWQTPSLTNPTWTPIKATGDKVFVDDDGIIRVTVPAEQSAAFYKIVSDDPYPRQYTGYVKTEELDVCNIGYLSERPVPGSVVFVTASDTNPSRSLDSFNWTTDDGEIKSIAISGGNRSVITSGYIDWASGLFHFSGEKAVSVTYLSTGKPTLPKQTEIFGGNISGFLANRPRPCSVMFEVQWRDNLDKTYTSYYFDDGEGGLGTAGVLNYITGMFGFVKLTGHSISSITATYVKAQ